MNARSFLIKNRSLSFGVSHSVKSKATKKQTTLFEPVWCDLKWDINFPASCFSSKRIELSTLDLFGVLWRRLMRHLCLDEHQKSTSTKHQTIVRDDFHPFRLVVAFVTEMRFVLTLFVFRPNATPLCDFNCWRTPWMALPFCSALIPCDYCHLRAVEEQGRFDVITSERGSSFSTVSCQFGTILLHPFRQQQEAHNELQSSPTLRQRPHSGRITRNDHRIEFNCWSFWISFQIHFFSFTGSGRLEITRDLHNAITRRFDIIDIDSVRFGSPRICKTHIKQWRSASSLHVFVVIISNCKSRKHFDSFTIESTVCPMLSLRTNFFLFFLAIWQ